MRLRKPCQHDRYDAHAVWRRGITMSIQGDECSGGEFLPDDVLVIDPKNVEEVAEALVVLDALMESFGISQDDDSGVGSPSLMGLE